MTATGCRRPRRNSDVPLITAVEVAAASEQDGPQAKLLIDAQPAEQRPDRLLGDTAYGTGPVCAELASANGRCPRAGARGGWQAGVARQARLRDRPSGGDGDLPGGQDGTDSHRALRPAARNVHQDTLRRLPAARALRRARARHAQVLIAPDEELLIAADRRSTTRPRRSSCAAPGRGSSGCSAYSPSATAPARVATSDAPRPACRPPGPPHWSTSTRSPAAWPPSPPDRPRLTPETRLHELRGRSRFPRKPGRLRSMPRRTTPLVGNASTSCCARSRRVDWPAEGPARGPKAARPLSMSSNRGDARRTGRGANIGSRDPFGTNSGRGALKCVAGWHGSGSRY